MIEFANCANVCAYVLRCRTDAAEDGSGSSGCGMRARIADIARLSGERGLYIMSGSDDGPGETGQCNGRSWNCVDARGGKMGK
jgi:hypothetical protein